MDEREEGRGKRETEPPARRKPTVRKKTRVSLNPRPFFVLGLGLNLFAGALYSPLTAIRRVRVEGAPVADQIRLSEIVQNLRNVPCAQVRAHALESEALRNPELRSAELSRTPFGTAVLRVETRRPVAQLGSGNRIGLSEDGVLYRATVALESLPKVGLPENYPSLGLILGSGWRATDVAHLAILVRDVPSPKPIGIVLDRGGRVCLNIGTGRVDLGSCEDLDAKVDRLREIIAKRPDLFSTVQAVNLVDVAAPTLTLRPVSARKP